MTHLERSYIFECVQGIFDVQNAGAYASDDEQSVFGGTVGVCFTLKGSVRQA